MLSALLALCEGNPPVTGGFPSQRASDTGFDVYFDASQNNEYRKISNVRCAKSQNLNDSRLVLQLSLSNLLKPGVKQRMRM